MTPYQLFLRNFMCYRGDVPPLNLDGLHVACLSGDNGAGKSALLDAMTWALWGKARMSDDDLITQGESDMLVDLHFHLDEQLYRVIRQRQRAKSTKKSAGKSTLDFQVWDDQVASWRSHSENTIRETQQKIDLLLRMTYDTFINASFLLQGRIDEFTSKSASERKQVLAEILDLGVYSELEERAKKQVKALHDQIRGLDGSIAHLQQEADKRDVYKQLVTEAADKVARLEPQLHAAEEAQQQADEQVRILQTKALRRTELHKRLADLRNEQLTQQEKIDTLRKTIADDEAVLQRQDEIMTGLGQLEAAQHELSRLENLQPQFEELQERRRQLQDKLKDEKRKLQSERDGHQREVQRLTQQIERQPTLQKDLAALEQRLAAMATLADELLALREQRVALDERIDQANALLRKRDDLTHQIVQRQDSLVAVREEQRRIITRLQRQLDAVPRWQAELAEAQAQQLLLQELSGQLTTQREQEQAVVAHLGEMRALRRQIQHQTETIKQRQELLQATPHMQYQRDGVGLADERMGLNCPLCGSDLGHDGVSTILDNYDQELTDLHQRDRDTQRDMQTHETSLAHLHTQIQTLEQQTRQAQQAVALIESLQQQLQHADEWQSEYEQAQKTLAVVEQQLDQQDYEREAREALLTVEAELESLGLLLDAPARTPARQSRSDKASDPLAPLYKERKDLERRQNALDKQLDARTAIERDAATKRHELQELERAAAALPAYADELAVLDQRIQQGDFGHEIRVTGRAVEADITALGYSVEAHRTASKQVQQLNIWIQEHQRLQTAQSRLESNRDSLQWADELLQRRATEIADLEHEDSVLEHELRALPIAEKRAAECAQTVQDCRRALDVSKGDLREKQVFFETSQKAQAQLVQKHAERKTVTERQGVFQELAEACGKKGVQAMLIETAVPEIEREANRLLSRITGNQMHVTFEMQRETKKGDTVETLEIKIADALGTRVYNAFSGGESTRINFAIRIALSRLLSRRAGASLETLVIDEGCGALDADGRDRFVDAIMSVQHDFKRILVVTHLDDLKERFPTRIEITKTSQGSGWLLI